jgi:iron complex outermembrane receptor protein
LLLALLIGVVLAFRPHAAGAGEVENIVVTAPRPSATERRAPTGFVTVIDPEEHAEQLETVTDALAESVGVQVRRFGGLGAFSTASIRGSSANQVQVYLDGIPLSRARNETVNLADLPLDSLERIEVYRGTVPVSFGSAGIGGVVNLVTKPPSATPSSEVSASFGSFTTRKTVASHTRRLHGIDVLAYVTYLGSQGDFDFLDDNGTPSNPTDDVVTARRNNAFDSIEALLKASTSIAGGLRLDLTSESFFKDQGVPGIGAFQSRTASLSDLRLLNSLRLDAGDLLAADLDLSGTVFGIYDRLDFRDLDGELGTGKQDRRDESSLAGGNLTGSYVPLFTPALTQTLSWFAELSHETFAPSNALATPANQPNQTRLHTTLGLQAETSLFDERLVLVPTVRYEHLRDDAAATFTLSGEPDGPEQTTKRDLFSASIGALARLAPGIELRANLGGFQRAPNFSELFGNRGGFVGNSDLKEETAINRDIGIVVTPNRIGWIDGLRFEYAYFNNDVDDLIVLVQNAQRVSRPQNVSSARLRGHELSLHTTLAGHLGIDTNYTHQDTEDRSRIPSRRGKQLPGRPQDELFTRIELFDVFGKLYYELSYVSGNFLDQVNFKPVPGRDTHTLGVAVHPLGFLTLSLEARNITDNQISDVEGFPLPGRAFFGTVKGRF